MVSGFKENKTKEEIYSKNEIDQKLEEVADKITIPTKTSELENDSGYITSEDLPSVPTKTSQLKNDSGFITSSPLTISAYHTAEYTLVGDTNLSPGAGKSGTATFYVNGYYPIGICGWYNKHGAVEQLCISGASKGVVNISYLLRNQSSSTTYTCNLKCWVTWAK